MVKRMRIAVVGGGPGGLFFAAVGKKLDPHWHIDLWDRGPVGGRDGFGVVLPAGLLGDVGGTDGSSFSAPEARMSCCSDIDIRVDDRQVTSHGHSFAAMGRRRLLDTLRERCATLGVTLHLNRDAASIDFLSERYDVVVAADGANSAVRKARADAFGTHLSWGCNKYIWLGTDREFRAFQFAFVRTPRGIVHLHGYPYGESASSIIVEIPRSLWKDVGLPDADWISDTFGAVLRGHRIVLGNSRWLDFATVANRTWRDGNIVLLGDAAHTTHYSVGSGTHLAMADARTLAYCLKEHGDISAGLADYETLRRRVVASAQQVARASQEWFENVADHWGQDIDEFAFGLLTRGVR